MIGNNNFKITIFTPTFNREHTLSRCYESIVKQDYDNFEWLIVDDGSTDATKSLIESFEKENRISIKYIYQNNSGKQAAWNNAVIVSKSSDFFMCVDSDDVLMPGAIESIIDYLSIISEDDEVIGLRCIAVRESTRNADSKFGNSEIKKDTWFNEIKSRKIGERIDVFKRSYLMEYLYPVEPNIKFIPESWFYSNVAKKYKFLYLNKPVSMFYDNHDNNRLSRSSIITHARGHRIARGAILRNVPPHIWISTPVLFLKTVIRYFQSVYYARLKK